MTQSEYNKAKEECWEGFWDEISGNIDFAPGVNERMKEHIYDTFDRAYALGKQEKDSEDTVIQGWLGRDQDGYISLFQEIPTRDTCDKGDIPYGFWGDNTEHYIELPITSFPDLTWDDEPQECEIIIKRKKK